MKDLDAFLKTIADGMKNMAQGVEVLAEKLEKIAEAQKAVKAKEKAKAATRPPRKASAKKTAKKSAPKKIKPMTAADTLFGIIKRSRKGVNTAVLMEKTGYNQKKVANLIYKLKKQGKIKSKTKGVYVKA
ncbi:MAG: hypothetical protein JRF27_03330 [Deltaproteobacteria bacterium]|nr:hypothetical protein [Deltaproteobacteria bacterium]